MPTSPKQQLLSFASTKKAIILQHFFKTALGEYGHGDVFIGVSVPNIRLVARQWRDLPLRQTAKLLHSKIHEERLLALLIFVNQYKNSDPKKQEQIFKLYLKNTKYINNWDLVDLSAGQIVGAHLQNKSKAILRKLAKSDNLWERRIAIISTFYDIYKGKPDETLHIAKILLHDKHDLIHKAVGWMLREVGKRCGQKVEEEFLNKHYRVMPRTMLRYAIERFPEKKRRQYLTSKI